jgi:hypothetical protein
LFSWSFCSFSSKIFFSFIKFGGGGRGGGDGGCITTGTILLLFSFNCSFNDFIENNLSIPSEL